MNGADLFACILINDRHPLPTSVVEGFEFQAHHFLPPIGPSADRTETLRLKWVRFLTQQGLLRGNSSGSFLFRLCAASWREIAISWRSVTRPAYIRLANASPRRSLHEPIRCTLLAISSVARRSLRGVRRALTLSDSPSSVFVPHCPGERLCPFQSLLACSKTFS